MAVPDDPAQVPAQLRAQLRRRVLSGAQPMGGIQPHLDAPSQVNFLLRGQQGDPADLIEIGAHRVTRSGQFGILATAARRFGLVVAPEIPGLLPGR